MRVIVHTVEDFVDNLRRDRDLVEGAVWIDRTVRKISEIKTLVNLQASCVVNVEGGQYLLQYGEDCGIDYEEAEPDSSGSEKAQERRRKLEDCCKELGLAVRPGIVDF